MLFVVRGGSFVVCCCVLFSVLVRVASCLLCVACCLLFGLRGSSRVPCRLLVVACCLMYVVCCVLYVVCCMLHVGVKSTFVI